MAKNKDVYYFSHDANARREDKCLALRGQYGWEGYGRFWALVEILREQTDYRLKVSSKFTIPKVASELGMTTPEAESFIRDLVNEFELLHTDGEFLWSDSLDRRMDELDGKRKQSVERGKKGAKIRWSDTKNGAENSPTKEIDSPTIKSDSPTKEIDSKERKGKESIGEEGKECGAGAPAPEEPPPKKTRVILPKPSADEAIAFFREKGYIDPENEGQKFWNYYEQIGWRVGKKLIPMTDWHLSASNWNIKNKQDQKRRVKFNEVYRNNRTGSGHNLGESDLERIARANGVGLRDAPA